MTTIAIVGAGTGLGAAAARRFGAEGYSVALISRSQDNVDRLGADLRADGYTARGYAASVRDPQALTAALGAAERELGPIEVLQYSPIPQQEFLRPVLETTRAAVAAAVEFSVVGPLVAVEQVLPGMRRIGRGSVLFVNGGSAVRPNPAVAGTSMAFAAESAYAQMLHEVLAPERVHVGQLIIPGAIEPGHPRNDPGILAETLWAMHTEDRAFRVFADEMGS
jgi:NAD(P)-dependent dehydrogenase (short-subunit alcohol dehydrogenase family)